MPRDTLTRSRVADSTDPSEYVEDTEESPVGRRLDRVRAETPSSHPVSRGWDGRRAVREKVKTTSNFPERLDLTDEPVLVRFMQPGPFESVLIHWLFNPSGQGKRPYLCLESLDGADQGDCSICNHLGDSPTEQTAFNVAVWLDGKWSLKVLTLGKTGADQVESLATGRLAPLDRPGNYFDASRTGGGKSKEKVAFHFVRITVDDLEADPHARPISAAEDTDITENLWASYSTPASAEDVDAAIKYNMKD